MSVLIIITNVIQFLSLLILRNQAALPHFLILYRNDWSLYTPKTNTHWLNYIVNMMATESKFHLSHLTPKQIESSLKPFLKVFPYYDSATSAFVDLFTK